MRVRAEEGHTADVTWGKGERLREDGFAIYTDVLSHILYFT